jgi:hypothetical protein
MGVRGRQVRTHRFAWELLRGPIPEGLQIDHLCRNPPCCNPAHMEVVTGRVNLLRSTGVSAINAAKTHCDNEHEFTPENTQIARRGAKGRSPESRVCRRCRSLANNRYHARKKGRITGSPTSVDGGEQTR